MLPRYRQHVAWTSNLLPCNMLPSTFRRNMLPWCKRGFRGLKFAAIDVQRDYMSGIYLVSSRSFRRRSVMHGLHAKRSFYCAVNVLFGKLLNVASVAIGLDRMHIPLLLYSVECCKVSNTDLRSNRLFTILFTRIVLMLSQTVNLWLWDPKLFTNEQIRQVFPNV